MKFALSILGTSLLVLPWVFPLAYGPKPAVLQWLVTMACLVGALLLGVMPKPRLIMLGWWLAAALSVVMGLMQYAGFSGQLTPWVAVSSVGEAFGNLRQRNQFATLCNMGFVALVYHAMSYKRVRPPIELAAIVLAGGLMVGNAASASRTGLLELLVLSVLLWGWGALRLPLPRRMLAAAWGCYVLAVWGLPLLLNSDATQHGLWARLRDGAQPCNSRLTLWSNVVRLIEMRPWTGWGWGELDYAHFITSYGEPRFCEILGNAHNLPLHLAAELGVPIAVSACGAGVWLLARTRPWREGRLHRQLAWAVLLILATHSLLEYPLWYGPFQMALILCLFLLTGSSRNSGASTGGSKASRGLYQGAVAVLLVIAYATWDYHRVSQIYLPAEARAAVYRENTFEKIRGSLLFAREVDFAAYSLLSPDAENACRVYAQGVQLLHYSPEPRVIETLIAAANRCGKQPEAEFFARKYRDAYPVEYERWEVKLQKTWSGSGSDKTP